MTQLEIVNYALNRIGGRRLASVTSGTSEEADVVNVVWTPLLSALQRERTWPFCVVRASLTKDATAPTWGYSYRYALPVDFLRLLQFGEHYDTTGMISDFRNMDSAAYRIEGGYILSNDGGPVKTRYIGLVTDPSKWDASFNEVMAFRLAMELCVRITGLEERRQAVERDFYRCLAAAARAGAMQTASEYPADDTWLLARA